MLICINFEPLEDSVGRAQRIPGSHICCLWATDAGDASSRPKLPAQISHSNLSKTELRNWFGVLTRYIN